MSTPAASPEAAAGARARPGGDGAPAPGRRVRLLVVGPLPPPIGGVETFTQALLESGALAAFEVAHCDTTKRRPRQTQGKFDAGNFVWAARHFLRLRRDLARFRPEVVYIPISGTWSGVLRDLALGAIARRSGARVLGHQHAGDFPRVLAHRGALAGTVRRGLEQFDRLLVLGERWRTLLRDYGLTMPIDLCPSTYRREVAERARGVARDFAAGPALRGLYVGQIGERKGVLELLEALARLRGQGLAIEFTFVGPPQLEGEREKALARRAALGLEPAASFPGMLTGDALYERFAAADLFALPSHNEGLPAVLYEAGVFQLPVVTTPVGAIPDLIENDRNGLLVPPRDVDALTGALGRLARDPELRRRLGTTLAADVAAYHPDRVGARVAAAVRALLEQPLARRIRVPAGAGA